MVFIKEFLILFSQHVQLGEVHAAVRNKSQSLTTLLDRALDGASSDPRIYGKWQRRKVEPVIMWSVPVLWIGEEVGSAPRLSLRVRF